MNEINPLMKVYLAKRANNPSYSERAFARSTGLSAGFLKLLFQGKRTLSPERAKIVAHRLGWSEIETREFLRAMSTLNSKGGAGALAVKADQFAEISDWYHFAILELLKTEKKLSPAKIASRLRIKPIEAEYALGLLEKHGLLEQKNGRTVPKQNYIVPTASSSAIRKFHRQCLEKAILAIEEQDKSVRCLRSLTLAIDPDRYPEAEFMIKKFVTQFEKKFQAGKLQRVYQLTLAFYGLDQEKK